MRTALISIWIGIIVSALMVFSDRADALAAARKATREPTGVSPIQAVSTAVRRLSIPTV